MEKFGECVSMKEACSALESAIRPPQKLVGRLQKFGEFILTTAKRVGGL